MVRSRGAHSGVGAQRRGQAHPDRRKRVRGRHAGQQSRGEPKAHGDKLMADKLNAESSAELKAEGSRHLDFAIEEFRAMKMQPALERALRHKGLLHA